jgi:hypothetical protein
MKTNSFLHVYCLILVIIAKNDCVIRQCFSEELLQRKSVVIQKITSDYHQLTNQELAEYLYQKKEIAYQSNPNDITLPPFSEFKEKILRSKEEKYGFRIRIINHDKEHFFIPSEEKYFESLEWVVEADKFNYRFREPIEIRVFLRNVSDKEIKLVIVHPIQKFFFPDFTNLKKVEKDGKKNVFLTKEGFKNAISIYALGGYGGGGLLHILPAKEQVLVGKTTLNQIYNFSQFGEYELTFYTRNFLADDEHQIGEYPKPCTIRFTIVDKIENNKQP